MSFFSGLLQEMKSLNSMPRFAPRQAPSAAAGMEISLLIPARNAADSIERTVRAAQEALKRDFDGKFEIIVIPNPKPNPPPGTPPDLTEKVTRGLCRDIPELRVEPHLNPPGKGAALRTGFLASSGRFVFFTDADLPYDLRFFHEAHRELNSGSDLVTGNRRLLDSEFDLPVGLLPLAYGRHRLGLLFNRVARLLFPIRTTDTQAGIKGFSRTLATRAFGLQACPGFFFDIELFLVAKKSGLRHREIPVTLFLTSEKSTVRLMRDAILAIFWLLRLSLRNRRGAYFIAGDSLS